MSNHFELPDELIATKPLPQRDASRLLVVDEQGNITDDHFKDITSWLKPGDVLVFNDAKVMHARLFGQRGGRRSNYYYISK